MKKIVIVALVVLFLLVSFTSTSVFADKPEIPSPLDAIWSSITDIWNWIDSFQETDPVYSTSPANGITAGNITDWNTAYSWGNHSASS